jgi:hypothetical protein
MKRVVKKFLGMFKTDMLNRSLLISFLVVAIIVVGGTAITYSRLETNGAVRVNPNIAFYFVGVESQTKTMRLDSLVPSNTPYLYYFNISNYDPKTEKKANVNLSYRVEFITTTNLPLSFQLYEYGDPEQTNLITNSSVSTDSNGVYYLHMNTSIVKNLNYISNTTHSFVLSVTFPEMHKYYPDELAGVVELIEVKVDSEQVVGGNNG